MIRDLICFILVIGIPIAILLACYLLYLIFQSCCKKISVKSTSTFVVATAPPITSTYPNLYQFNGILPESDGYAVLGMTPNSRPFVHGSQPTEYAQLMYPNMK